MALASFGPEFLWDGDRTLSALAVALNLAIGLGLIRVHCDYLRSLDEMQQRIYQESMGLALGVGVAAGLAYRGGHSCRPIELQEFAHVAERSDVPTALAMRPHNLAGTSARAT